MTSDGGKLFSVDDLRSYYRVTIQSPNPDRAIVNLIGVGPGRAGTTSLFHILAASPSVYVTPIKEANYFGLRDTDITIREYHRLFPALEAAPYVAEISPSYLAHPRSRASIKRYNPYAKIIVTLRDPIARLVSQFKHYKRDVGAIAGEPAILGPLRDYVDIGIASYRTVKPNLWFSPGRNVRQSMYADDLAGYLHDFKSNVLVLLFEDLARDPSIWIASLSKFLDVEVSMSPHAFGANASDATTELLGQTNLRALRSIFAPDIRATERLLGRDLRSLWTTSAHPE